MHLNLKLIAGGVIAAGIVAIIACQVANTPASDAPPSTPPAPEPMPAEAPVEAPPPVEPAGSGVTPDLREAPSASPRADGAACSEASQCASGICEGEGCGDEQGRCAAKAAPCTRDLVTYCGCDGKTFQASGSCARQRYARRGACGESGAK